MKSRWMSTMLSGLAVGLGTSILLADKPANISAPPAEPGVFSSDHAEHAAVRSNEQKDTMKSDTVFCRASDLIRMKVENKEGTQLGSIEDLVFDPKTGTIRYAALARGGVLGIGEKLVAVPWNAFEFKLTEREHRAFRPEEQPQAEAKAGVVSGSRFRLILDMDAKTLDNHPGFKKDKWPESGDANLIKKGAQEVHENPAARSPENAKGKGIGLPDDRGGVPHDRPRD